MKKKKRRKFFKLSAKIAILYATISFIIMGVLVLTFIFLGDKIFQNFNSALLQKFYNESLSNISKNIPIADDYNGIIYFTIINKKDSLVTPFNLKIESYPNTIFNKDDLNIIKEHYKNEGIINKNLRNGIITNQNTKKAEINETFKIKGKNIYFFGHIEEISTIKNNEVIENSYNVLVVFSDESFAKSILKSLVISIELILLGLYLILFTIGFFVTREIITKRLKKLNEEAKLLNKSNFSNKITVKGNDEITELAESVDNLKNEISETNNKKREFLQNISHDIKNPVGIIKSYAEAIEDGIADISDIKIIKNQSVVLSNRINQLITFVKLENIDIKYDSLNNILIKEILVEIQNENKYNFKGEIILNTDETKYKIERDKFKIAIQNIIENAIRYAKNKIEITLKDNILTIFNDGPNINEDFLDSIFIPYEKSQGGQFGLGMSITKNTLKKFSLDIKVKNQDNGVSFIIFPL